MAARILTINGGSSSLKFALFEPGRLGAPPRRLLSGAVDRIGQRGSKLTVRDGTGQSLAEQSADAPDHAHAVEQLFDYLAQGGQLERVQAVGHRIVHGGPRFVESAHVTHELLTELARLAPIDPAHLPGEIALIEAIATRLPNVAQVACFDTAFHRDLPRVAQLLPIPRRYEELGLRRYGFHGLSFTYLLGELAREAGPAAAGGRVVLAHLGAGASLAAVRDGKCVDTSMSFTPTAGLVMATRCGDLDPGVLIYLMRSQGMSADQLDEMLNKRAGLLGISDSSGDMRDLEARQSSDVRAAEAVAVFCYQAKKWIGAFAAALGGLDTLVFSGGIGEHAAPIRQQICSGLEFLGVRLDAERNADSEAVISAAEATCTVPVIATDEEAVIVADVERLCPAIAST